MTMVTSMMAMRTHHAHDHHGHAAASPPDRTRREPACTSCLIAPFVEFGFMQRALAGSLMLSLGACPVGVFLMLRRMSLTGDAMAHAILPGAAAGFLLYGLEILPMTIGGLIAGVIVAHGRRRRLALHGPEGGRLDGRLLPDLARARRADRVAARLQRRPDACAVRHGAGAQRRGAGADRRHRRGDARRARHLLAGAGRRMPRPAVPALGQPARHAGAFHLPRPGRAQPRRRLPGAGHAALGRADDAAGGGRALLDRARRADVRAGGR